MNFLDIGDWKPEQIQDIFDLTDRLCQNREQPLLQGKTFLLLFPESSLRTRVSFDRGIRDLRGKYIYVSPEALNKREQLADVMGYMENWADAAVIRHPDLYKLRELSRHASIPVINAMTSENHPCEIMSDLYAISRRRPDYQELVYTFVGPAGNISRTWMSMAKTMNLKFHHVCAEGNALGPETANYTFHTRLDAIVPDSDILLTDSLPEEYRTAEYIAKYQLDLQRVQQAKPGALLNPCPPFFRGEEVGADAIDSDYFAGYGFKQCLLYVQQAIMLYCLFHSRGAASS
ncbi:ornithine carbamoyltransferase [Paenibacillus forsythiae]|uniref:Ornithine carbamoyltransferase n=1 Tax=Paenibacillus forsythiae TaxID=365616 RepID=A0ABU3H408_9BACL|nr:ornithine carbamoyltransferase [Paenibacillus forsythiae]MDT3425560.1 ornithine carbamoyltransferase [Paenibacillus forsythiae]